MPRKLSTVVPGLAAAVFGIAALIGGCTDIRTAEPSHESPTSAEPATQHLKLELAANNYGPVSADVPRKPIASAPTNAPGMRFEVYQLKRTAKTVVVVFALHNTGQQAADNVRSLDSLDATGDVWVRDAGKVSLLDPTGLKEYRAFYVEPGEHEGCLCSITRTATNDQDFEPGERRYYATVVAAPPSDVKKVTVLGGAATIPDVPITD